jgi:hypothetical protein
MDIDDLQKLRICNKCHCAYMPIFDKTPYTYFGDYWCLNPDFCERCEEIKNEKTN